MCGEIFGYHNGDRFPRILNWTTRGTPLFDEVQDTMLAKDLVCVDMNEKYIYWFITFILF